MYKKTEIEIFKQKFPDTESCFSFLANRKWVTGFVCKKCGHSKFSANEKHERTCTACKYRESPLVDTFFHGTKLSIDKAFLMTYSLCLNPSKLSLAQLSLRYGVSIKTAAALRNKVLKSLESYGMKQISGLFQFENLILTTEEEVQRVIAS